METASTIGYWQLSIIMVLIASWFLYRYIVPTSWREWSRAGLVQAFIITLYAEMYGLPLTIPSRPSPLPFPTRTAPPRGGRFREYSGDQRPRADCGITVGQSVCTNPASG